MQRFLYTEKRDIKVQWKYVVLQYLVLGPGLGLEPQVLVNITDRNFATNFRSEGKKAVELVLETVSRT